MSALAVTEVFSHALLGETCWLTGPGLRPVALPVEDWLRPPDDADRMLVALCDGPTLDIGCGPGRLTAELAARGHVALGIDLVHEAVGQTRRRGGAALLRDVFAPLPAEGRWHTVLLADGNVGIGGDPTALLHRSRRLLAPGGRAVVEVAGPGVASHRLLARLECACGSSDRFPWSILALADAEAVARAAGFGMVRSMRLGERWAVVLQEAS